MKNRKFLLLGSLLLAGCSAQATADQSKSEPKSSAPIVCKLREGFTPEAGYFEAKNKKIVSAIPEYSLVVIANDGDNNPDKTLRSLGQDAEFCEYDEEVGAEFIPNDSIFPRQWYLPKIDAPGAWDISRGAGVVVALLDSGVDPSVPDLQGKIVPGKNFSDPAYPTSDTSDTCAHGTKVAGVLAASTNNVSGIASVGFGVKVMPLKVTTSTCGATSSSVAAALAYATSQGIRIANYSYLCSSSLVMATAVKKFREAGGVFIQAAGNQGVADACQDSPDIIYVGATDQNDLRATFSNYGAFVDVWAPGTSIYLTVGGNSTTPSYITYGSGTSYSAPLVSGAAALILAASPSITADDLEFAIESKATALPWTQTAGRLNVKEAVSSTINQQPATTPCVCP